MSSITNSTPTTVQWDPQLTKWGVDKVQRHDAKWKLVSARPLNETDMGQASVIVVVTEDETGKRKASVICNSDWEGRDPKDAPPTPIPTESYPGPKFATCQFPMTGVIRYDEQNGKLQSRGNHAVWVGDRATSDEVTHMGLVTGKPTSFEVIFRLQPTATPKPPVKK